MIEFNPDGSIKLPEFARKSIEANEQRMKVQRCMHVKKRVVSFESPKKCLLTLKASESLQDMSFVERVYSQFNANSEVPTKLAKISSQEYEIEIGTCFRRCSDCKALIERFRVFLDGNVIEEKGSCTYGENSKSNFCYEDYFE